MTTLPYVSAPGNVERTLNAIKAAATPDFVSQDFVKTVLGIKGGSGDQMTAHLKKLGFTAADRSPSDLYKKFRNQSTEGWAIAKAMRTAYAPLYVRNEYVHKLPDDQLRGLIIEETGAGDDSTATGLILSCIKQLKKFAKWDSPIVEGNSNASEPSDQASTSRSNVASRQDAAGSPGGIGLNFGYTINLNLPATSDPAVFNAIFNALREHLLRSAND